MSSDRSLRDPAMALATLLVVALVDAAEARVPGVLQPGATGDMPIVGVRTAAPPGHGGGAEGSAGAAAPDRATGTPPRTGGRPTFARDIAPLIHEHCGPCHHPGGSAPFSLLTYQSAKKRARQLAVVTASRFMPPWLPEPGYGEFAGARTLRAEQIELFRRWAEEGTAEGAAEDQPPVPVYRDGWQLGKPDLVLSIPDPYTLAAGGTDQFRNFVFTASVPARRYVRAVEILPGNPRVVHHANVQLDRHGSARRLDEADPGVGFADMKVKLESRGFEPQTHFLFWKPGTVPSTDPDDMAWPLDRGTDLVLNMHLKPSGKPEAVQPSLGLHFCDGLPTKFPMLLQLEHDGALDIPAGAREFVVTDEYELPLDVEALGIYPHAHYLGKEIQAYATLPGGERRWLVWIRKWDLDWQAVYRYARPVPLPRGTVITMRWTYDNSEENQRNPNHPPVRVRAGNRSTDEMSHLWIQVLPRREEDRKVLWEALMRQKVRKYPRDFESRVNLAAVLQSMGRMPDAIAVYREALAIKPGDPTAENNLGAALLATGLTREKLDAAIGNFNEALRGRPDYIDARFNLGNALLARGDPAGAAVEFRRLLEADPVNADARDRLGSALLVQGEVGPAEEQFRAALSLAPDHPSAHYNLGYVLARRGDLDGAAEQLERAIRLRPAHSNAHNVLGFVYESQGRLDEAEAQFEQAVRLDPGNADAREKLGRIRARSGPNR